MMSRHFHLRSELSGAMITKKLSVPDSFLDQFVTYIYIYIYTSRVCQKIKKFESLDPLNSLLITKCSP